MQYFYSKRAVCLEKGMRDTFHRIQPLPGWHWVLKLPSHLPITKMFLKTLTQLTPASLVVLSLGSQLQHCNIVGTPGLAITWLGSVRSTWREEASAPTCQLQLSLP